MKRFVLFALLLAFVSCHETFVATNEWQEIKEGQKVPGGLHYRLNFETGKKEAKLLDPTDSDPDEPNQVVATQLEGEHPEPESISDDKAKALREQMAKMMVSKDVEHIKHLMANYHNSSIETKLVILEDLEYYMHQVDNARDFVSLRGFETIIAPCLVDPECNANVTAATTVLLGSSVQSNTPVRDHAMKIGMLDALLNNNLARDDAKVVSRTIFALSTLLRQNSGGLDEFNRADGGTKLFKKLSTMEGDGPDVVRAKIKGLSFLSDLHDSIELLDSSHCDLFDDVQLFESLDLGRIEVLSNAIQTFNINCDLIAKPALAGWMKKAKLTVASEIEDEEDDEDFLKYLKNILQTLTSMSETSIKSEL